MFKFLNLQPEIFGVDVNDLSLRIVKLKKKRKGFVVVSCSEVLVPPDVIKEGVVQNQDALVEIIKKALAGSKGKKLGTRYAIISLPEEKSFSQVIQMPRMTHQELVSAVPLEAENYIPLPIDKVYLDFQIIDSHQGNDKNTLNHVDLLINVIPKTIADTYVACFKKAGLIPCILEVESQAIARALMKEGTSTSPIIFIDLGNANTSFIIFSGNSIRFTSSIPISSNQLTLAIAQKTKVSFDKAEELKLKFGLTTKKGEKNYDIVSAMDPLLSDLAQQIKKYIEFYRDHVSHEYFPLEGNIEKIVLCGGGANLKELTDFLFKKLAIPVVIGDPCINLLPLKKGKNFLIPTAKAQSFATALGLALRGASQGLLNEYHD